MDINSLGNMLTSHCTLRCKNCCAAIPQLANPSHVPTSLLKDSFNRIFEIFSFIGEFGLYGGEALLHPDIDEIIIECEKYKNQIGFMRLMLNGTVVPKPSTIKILKNLNLKYDIQVDDYGKASFRLNDILNIIELNGLPLRLIRYNEHEQYCGGWIDFGMEYEYKNYTYEQLSSVFKNCHSKDRCFVHWAGILYRCQFAASGEQIGKVPYIENNSVNLLNNKLSIEEIRKKIKRLDDLPVEACKYCNGFDIINGKRIPAGVQI